MTNITLAIPAAASEIPPNPKIPATIAITIQIKNHFSIIISFWLIIGSSYKALLKNIMRFVII